LKTQHKTRGHKQCWHFARGIIPQLGKTYCIKMPFRIANRTAHTAKRLAVILNEALKFYYLHEK
jgi:hypothetical protein